MFEDETFVFTPKGDVINLPNGSNCIDFAYAIHSAVGNKMVGAKVNGNIVPIDYVLQNGQIVEVLTSASSKGPSRDWLKLVRSGEARNKIRQYFKKEMRAENIVIGKYEVERELKRYGRHFSEAQKNEIVKNVSSRIGLPTADDLYNNIGYGGISVSKLAAKFKDEFDRTVSPLTPEEPKQERRRDKRDEKLEHSVIIDSVSGCQAKFAKCCNPLPGDSIIGFITRGYGVSIHRYDCPNAMQGLKDPHEKDRWVVASWTPKALDRAFGSEFEAALSIYVDYKPSILADITVALTDMKVAVTSVSVKENDGNGMIVAVVRSSGVEHLRGVMNGLKRVDGVRDVVRGSAG